MNLCLLLVTVLLCAIAKWLWWQPLKEHTIIPYGRHTVLYGIVISLVFKSIYYLIVIINVFTGNWDLAIIMLFCILIGNYFAKILERKLYAQNVIDLVDTIIKEYPNAEESFILSLVALPLWWFKLMPRYWQEVYISKIESCKH